VAFDINRMAAAALDAAVNGDQRPRRRLSGLRALAMGAALAGAARVALKRGPDLAPVARLEELADDLRDRLADRGWIDEPEDRFDDEELDDEELGEDEDPPDEDEDDDSGDDEDYDIEDEADLEDEADDDYEDEDEDDDEDEDEDEGGDEDFEDEEDGDEPEQEENSPPPVARHGNGNDVDPAARPPKPPEKRQKSKAGRS
jgi:hypothetical protein